jgi:hypothetical protein
MTETNTFTWKIPNASRRWARGISLATEGTFSFQRFGRGAKTMGLSRPGPEGRCPGLCAGSCVGVGVGVCVGKTPPPPSGVGVPFTGGVGVPVLVGVGESGDQNGAVAPAVRGRRRACVESSPSPKTNSPRRSKTAIASLSQLGHTTTWSRSNAGLSSGVGSADVPIAGAESRACNSWS